MVLSSHSFRAAVIGACLLLLVSLFVHDALALEEDIALYGIDCFVTAIQEIDRTWPFLLALAALAILLYVERLSCILPARLVSVCVRAGTSRAPPTAFLNELFSSGILHTRVYA